MRKITKIILGGIILLLLSGMLGAQSGRIDDKAGSWAKETEGFSFTILKDTKRDGLPIFNVVHPGKQDYAITFPKLIDVKPGDIYRITCQICFNPSGSSATGISAVARKKEEVITWGLGRISFENKTDWKQLETKFIIPKGITTIQPRFTGFGPQSTLFSGFRFEKIGHLDFPDENKTQTLENSFLKLTFFEKDGTFDILDKRTGRVWKQSSGDKPAFIRRSHQSKNRIDFTILYSSNFQEYNASVELAADVPEVIASIDKKDHQSPLETTLFWPFPFVPEKKDRIVLPVNEGISFPVTERPQGVSTTHTYGGHGLCMGFWANIEDKIGQGGSGYIGIVETPDDMNLKLECVSAEKNTPALIYPFPGWVGQLKKFGYKRSVRYAFFDKGGHVAACKRYREYAKKIGLYCPFTEKVKRNPNLKKGFDLLIGSANIWYFSNDRVQIVKEMKEAGMDLLLWSAGGSGDELRTMNEMGGVLTSRYDIYQDLMDPANLDKVGLHPDWTQDAWPHDINWTDPDGTWRKGWGVFPKGVKSTDPDANKKRIRCAVLCDSKALPYAEKRISKELESRPYKGRFIDTTVAAPWYECYNPAHPMTRTDSKHWKMKLLDLMGSRFNLVCGSETGHEASVPYCDFYEGMTSLGPYRLPHGGWTGAEFNDPTPEYIVKYQTGADYRLPLWELVYHDCTVSYYYWYDFSNRRADIWPKRDLISALYGVPPMYRLTRKIWDEQKDLFAASYKIACRTSRETGWSEMTDHRILTEDRLVQQSFFSNGFSVIANFSDKTFTCSDGITIGPQKCRFMKK